MARPIWRGSLSFGLVAIPVQLHTAVARTPAEIPAAAREGQVADQIRAGLSARRQACGLGGPGQRLRVQKGRYVVLTKEDFKAAALEKDRRVQVSDFVPAEAIDDRYFDQPYYLLPDKGGEHAYAVFQQALAETGRVGIGKVVMREKQHLVAVESIEGRLVLTMMRFAEEVVEAPEVSGLDRIKVPPKELKLATDLIDALATDWEPEKYTDDYQANLQEVIKGKLKGETVVLEEEEAPMRAEVVDLAERLRRASKRPAARARNAPRKARKRRSVRRRPAQAGGVSMRPVAERPPDPPHKDETPPEAPIQTQVAGLQGYGVVSLAVVISVGGPEPCRGLLRSGRRVDRARACARADRPRLARLIPRWIASALVVSFFVGALGALAYVFSDEAARAIAELPTATRNLRQAFPA